MTYPERGRPGGGRFGIGPLFLTILLAAIWFVSLRPAVDPDYGWHIQNGRHVFDGSVFGGRDLYSWTASGYWIVHEWATEAAMAALHDSVGAAANSIAAALLGTIAFGLVALRLRRRGAGWTATLVSLLLAFLGSIMSVGVRPQVLELVYLAALGIVLDRWIGGRISYGRFLMSVGVGTVVWTNTHGSFPLLFAVVVLASAGMLVDGDRRWVRAAGAAVAGACLALLNPWGFRIYEFATQSVMSKPTLALIDEWKRPQLITGSLIPFDVEIILAAAAALAVVAGIRARRRGTEDGGGAPPQVRASDVTIAAGLLYLALSSGRHVMLFGVGAAPLIVWSIERLVSMAGRRRRQAAPRLDTGRDSRGTDLIHAVAGLAVTIALVISGWALVSPRAQREALLDRYPVALVDEVRMLNRPPERLLNEYGWGGYLIERGATPVFIDGRSELYGDAQLLRYARLIHLEEGWKRTLDSLGVTLILMPRQSRLATAVEDSGWTIIAHDSVGSVLRKP